jgi:WD40 repeat protein
MVPSARSDPEFKPVGGVDESEKPRNWVVRKLYQRGNGYHKDPCIRTLPWIWEWAIILLRTRADGWTTRQQRMMGAATRFYLASVLGLSVLIVGVGVGVRLLRPVPPAPVVLPVIETVDRSGLEAYAALLAEVTTELNAVRFHKANEILDRADAKLRHWEWRYLKGICDIWMSDVPAKESATDPSLPKQPGTGRVNSVHAPRELPPGAPSPDGLRLVTVGTNEVVSTEDGHVLKALNKITLISFDQVAYSPNGRRYVTIDREKGMRFWDTATDTPLGESRKINERIIQMTFSADGSRLITVGVSPGGEFNVFGPLGNRAVITVWDPERGGDPITSVYGLEHRFRGRLAVSHDGTRFAVGSLHDSARVYKTDRGTVAADLEGHTQPVFGLVFSPDGRHLIASSLDLSLERKIARGEIKVWDLEKGVAVQEFPGPALGTVISPDGNLLFAAEVAGRLEGEGGDRSIRIFDLRTGELGYEIPGPVRGLAFTPDGKRFVALMKEAIVIRETTTGTELLSLPIKPPEPRGRIAAGALMFSSDGLRLLLPGRSDDKRKATEPTRVWYAPASTKPDGRPSPVP